MSRRDRASRSNRLRRIGTAATLSALAVAAGAGIAPPSFATRGTCAGTSIRGLMLFSARTGAVINSFPHVDQGYAASSDGQGGWFVAGDFHCLAGSRHALVLHLRARGDIDHAWRPQLPAAWRDDLRGFGLVRVGRTLYANGAFGVIALDATTGATRWAARVSGTFPDFGPVAFAATRSTVYLGGSFDAIDGHPSAGLVALDARTGAPVRWTAPSLGGGYPINGRPTPSYVDALAVGGSRLYIGGNTIRTVGGRARPGFAALDARTGALLPWTPGTAPGSTHGSGVGDVETILASGSDVFSAGHDGFGIVSAQTGKPTRWMRMVRGVASRFAAIGNTVYLGGDNRNGFSGVGKQSRNNLAAIDLALGRVDRWSPPLPRYVGVLAIAADPQAVLVVGSFSDTLG